MLRGKTLAENAAKAHGFDEHEHNKMAFFVKLLFLFQIWRFCHEVFPRLDGNVASHFLVLRDLVRKVGTMKYFLHHISF